MIDTHSHLYDQAFDADRGECVAADRAAGVEAVMLPAIDSATHIALWALCREYPGYCYPMIGLHPTSVNEIDDFRVGLDLIEKLLENPPVERFYGIGEIGLDLYWSRERQQEQSEAFARQIELSLRYGLPVAIHTRDAWEQMHGVLSRYAGRGLRGVMHAFSGTSEDYRLVKSYGDFLFGIGGVVTYKKGELAGTVAGMSIEDIVLESDAPYLPPVPFRGKRNCSAMMAYTRDKISQLHGLSPQQVDSITTANAKRMFAIP